MNIGEWAQFVGTAVGGAFGLFCFFDGTRRLVGANSDGRASRLLVLGILIVGLLAANAYWQHWEYTELARAYRGGEPPKELPAEWGRKMSPAKREASSQNQARGTYIASGEIRQYFDISGQRKTFSPAPDDNKRREGVVANTARLEQKAAESFHASILWLVLALSAFVFGVAFALEPTPKPVDDSEARLEPTLPTSPAPAPLAKPAVPAAAPQPVASAKPVAPAKPAIAATPAIAAKPAAPAKPSAGINTVPLAKADVGSDTVPLPKPAIPGDTTPLPKPAAVGSDTIPLAKPGVVPPTKT
jgi:hypothetical protein